MSIDILITSINLMPNDVSYLHITFQLAIIHTVLKILGENNFQISNLHTCQVKVSSMQ